MIVPRRQIDGSRVVVRAFGFFLMKILFERQRMHVVLLRRVGAARTSIVAIVSRQPGAPPHRRFALVVVWLRRRKPESARKRGEGEGVSTLKSLSSSEL